ncbi:F0F1 ATP synthase subunit delta [Hyphococcus luteus]|uniref:F0F1 ATP synthase subunit delta n=1 Tax=Hyphococcus luteus TaxID=2058213 RepID=UPI001A9C5645|nr:F0F1 ATP synthase subunit delta [Marinicaulis flavus]
MSANTASASSSASADHAPISGVAGRYATALFDLARDAGAIEKVEEELKSLRAAIDGSPDLQGFLASPVYDRAEQVNTMTALGERAGFSALTANFLKLVAKNRRLFALEDMIRAFCALAADERGEVSAEAATAAPMTDDQVKALRLEIERMVGKAVNLNTRVDPDLLGGLVVKIGSTMVDASLKTKLNRLKTEMKKA